MILVSILGVNRPFRNQIDRPEGEQCHNRLYGDVGVEHLNQGIYAKNPCEGDQREEDAVYGNGDGIGDEDARPLGPLPAGTAGPQVIDIGVDELGNKSGYDGSQHNS